MTGATSRLCGAARAAAALLALLLLPAAAVETRQRPQDPGSGRVHQTDASYDWAWGELLYGRTYSAQLTIENKCRTPQVVSFFVFDPVFQSRRMKDGQRVTVFERRRPPIVDGRAQLEVQPGQKMPVSARAMLSIPAAGCMAVPFGGAGSQAPTTCQMVVPPGQTPVDLTIVTPAPPDLSGVIIPPGFDPLSLFDEIEGELVAYTPGQPPACLASREEYLPSGHVHLDPDPAPAGGGGPRCRDWWDTEQKPRGLTRDCTGEIRDLALTYIRITLAPLVAADPKAWAWLPAEEAVFEMTAEQLIAMKVRARSQMQAR